MRNSRTDSTIRIPGTLDESRIGFPDLSGKKWHHDNDINAALYQTDQGIRTRLTRICTYEGAARISRFLAFTPTRNKRVFLDVERSRHLTLEVNGSPVPPCSFCSVSTPYSFELTGLLSRQDTITLICNNSYPSWPHDAIVFSSAATDETQTNWNGLLGYVRLREEESAFIAAVRVYPHGDRADVCIDMDADRPQTLFLHLSCAAFAESEQHCTVVLSSGHQSFWLRDLPFQADVRRWDEGDGQLYLLTATLGSSIRRISFGVRDFQAQRGHLTLNGRRIFLRSEANCAVFPETGYPPMDVASWKQILAVYRSYGGQLHALPQPHAP